MKNLSTLSHLILVNSAPIIESFSIFLTKSLRKSLLLNLLLYIKDNGWIQKSFSSVIYRNLCSILPLFERTRSRSSKPTGKAVLAGRAREKK